MKAVVRKKTWVVVFSHSGKKGGKTDSVGLGGLDSFVVVHVATDRISSPLFGFSTSSVQCTHS
jgi:hypothetical protein